MCKVQKSLNYLRNLIKFELHSLKNLGGDRFFKFLRKSALKKFPSIHLNRKRLTKMTISQNFIFFFNSVKIYL